MTVDKVHPLAFEVPSLQSQISQAEYKVDLIIEPGPPDIQAALATLLAQEHLALAAYAGHRTPPV